MPARGREIILVDARQSKYYRVRPYDVESFLDFSKHRFPRPFDRRPRQWTIRSSDAPKAIRMKKKKEDKTMPPSE